MFIYVIELNIRFRMNTFTDTYLYEKGLCFIFELTILVTILGRKQKQTLAEQETNEAFRLA